jgi:hypothetical protein
MPEQDITIGDSQFGWREYNRSHTVKGQWAFGGVERESRKTSLLPFLDRTADTLMAVLREWMEPGTTILKIYTLVLPTFLYGSENWTLTALQRRRIGTAEMKLLRPLARYTL